MSEEIIVNENTEVAESEGGKKTPGNRKDMVKNVAIAFLSVMLVLTFFSNTIMNYSLPQVATRQIMSGSISPQIRGTGTVTAEDPYNVILKETRKISGVALKEGAHVEIGDVIYYLEDRESTELTDAREKLDDMEMTYEQNLFSGDVPNDVISRVRSGSTATYDSYQAQLKDVNGRYDAAVQAVADAKAVVTYLTTYKTLDVNGVNYDKLTPEYTSAQAALDKADVDQRTKDLNNSLTDISARLGSINDLITQKTYLDSLSEDDPAYLEIKASYEASLSAYEKSYGQVDNLQEERDKVAKKQSNVKSDYSAYNSRSEDLQHIIDNNTKDISQLGTYANQLGISYDQKITKANQLLSEAEAALEVVTDERDKALKSINTEISLCSQRDRIQKQRDKIAKMEEDSVGASIKAPVAGTISSLSKVAGESTSADETVAVIQVDGKDMTTSFSVTTAQAQKLKVGDPARPQNVWQYGDDFKATLTSIRNDKTDPQGKRVLTFKIESKDVTPGQSISLTIGERSVEYDMVVPNSAIKTDTNGKFILVVTSKSSPLGNRYITSRVDVVEKAKDDNNTAISAALDGDEFVVTTSSEDIEPGSQVRLANQ